MTESVQNSINKKIEKSFNAIKEESKIESSELPNRTLFKPELSNEGKPTTSEEGEDHVAEVVRLQAYYYGT